MNDYMYLFTVFIAMGAVTAAERLLPFACSSWCASSAGSVLWAIFFRSPLWSFWFCTPRPAQHSPVEVSLFRKPPASSSH